MLSAIPAPGPAERYPTVLRQLYAHRQPNGKNLPQWQQWTDTTNGPSSLIVNATKDKAVIDQSHTHTTIKEVLDEMAADQTLTNAQKKTLIQQVMNGRWFSSQMDARFKNMK